MSDIASICPKVMEIVVDLNSVTFSLFNHYGLNQLPVYKPGLSEQIPSRMVNTLFLNLN
jgi:hypothetical protein